jgi:ParB family chromosome partitioning protein
MAIKPQRRNVSKEKLEEKVRSEMEKNNFTEVLIDSIASPKWHDRKYIDKHSIVELSESIKSTGLIYPIVLRRLKDGTLERMIGFRRIEAFKILKKKKIPAIILENISDEAALLYMTTENLQRENLSPYDETLALIDYVSVALGVKDKDVLKILNRFKNYDSGKIQLKQDEKKKFDEVEQILSKTGRITISTLVNRFPMLNIHPLLKEALSQGKLSFSNAKLLDTIKDEKLLSEAIAEVLSNGYSKRETAALVKSIVSQPKENEKRDKLKMISKIKLDRLDEDKAKEIERLIDKIIELSS